MLISQKQLKKIAVETQSGQFLGYVAGFELETDTGAIEKYYVKNKISLSGLLDHSLIIHKSQIINFDHEKMVVEDNVVKATSGKIRQLVEVKKLDRGESAITSELDNQ